MSDFSVYYNIRVDWKQQKNRYYMVLVNRYYTKSMSDGEEISSISQDPVNILFNPSVIQKKDVWSN